MKPKDWDEQQKLVDPNMFKKIKLCFIEEMDYTRDKISVTYEDGTRERIFTFKKGTYKFDYHDFIGMTKLEAVFFCDRKEPIRQNRWH